MRQTTKRFGGESARGPLSPCQVSPAKNVEFFLSVCLSVCLSVTLLNVRVCAPDIAMKALEYKNDFDAVGRLVVVHPCSTFLDFRQLSTSLNAEVQKNGKIVGFRRQRATE